MTFNYLKFETSIQQIMKEKLKTMYLNIYDRQLATII